jgi:hypothetical protein
MDSLLSSSAETPDGSKKPSKTPVKTDEYTDGRKLWEWESKFPQEAQENIKLEARWLILSLFATLLVAGFFLGLGGTSFEFSLPIGETPPTLSINCKVLGTFFTGCVGGVTFSIKWLVHSAATGKWHLDRRYWRLLVPWIGGVYALVVLALFDAGLFARAGSGVGSFSTISPALAFLVGYFSDGVSGLLSNVANAVFGTLEKK